MATVLEFYDKVRTTLLADTTLKGLLATTTAIYYDTPPKSRQLPCITYNFVETPDMALDTYGKFFHTMTIDIWGTNLNTLFQILDRIDYLIFDKVIESTNYRGYGLRRGSTNPIATPYNENGVQIHQLTAEYPFRLLNLNY